MFVLETGDKIQGGASAAAVVDYHISGLQGSTLANLADGQLASPTGDLYVSAGTDVVKTIVITNTDTTDRTVNLYYTTSGGIPRRIIPKDLSLKAGYTIRLDGNAMQLIDTSGATVTSIDSTGIVSVTGDAMTGELNMADNLITRAQLKDYSFDLYDHGTVSGPVAIDLEVANFHRTYHGGNVSFGFLNPIADGDASTIILELENPGAFLTTFPTSVKWAGGTAPVLTASGVDILAFYTRNGGVIWNGSVIALDSR